MMYQVSLTTRVEAPTSQAAIRLVAGVLSVTRLADTNIHYPAVPCGEPGPMLQPRAIRCWCGRVLQCDNPQHVKQEDRR